MDYKRVLTMQDISCFGQCSLTVALPIISACKIETTILPSAVLSTHTGGFSGFTFRDLTDDIPKIIDHWEKEEINFDAFYTGYLGSLTQIEYVKDISKRLLKKDSKLIVDPAMGDNGKLYSIFDLTYAKEMAKLCKTADIVLPNVTEACFMTGVEYKENYDEEYVDNLLRALTEIGCKTIVLTGIGYTEDTTGVVVYENGKKEYYKHKKIEKGCHGTGDVFSSAFVGAYMQGKTLFESAKISANYTLKCIENTQGDKSHWYGVKFETALDFLIDSLK
ncbi:MAG: pyridoxamine kinase [Clostridiales bacterium]|nr:pyridoxamine kinase [Clostridiales bacterium]